jgi:hypothetical protein
VLKRLKGRRPILKLIAITLLAGLLTNMAFDLYDTYEELLKLQQISTESKVVGQLSAPSSNLFTFNRQTTEENELHRYTPHQAVAYPSATSHIIAKNHGRNSIIAFEIWRADVVTNRSIIILHQRFTI